MDTATKSRWSLSLGRLAGVDVYVHASFLLLVAFLGFSDFLASGSLGVAAAGVAFILAVFGSVLLHEIGHALAARHYGIPTLDITLYPIGGVAKLARMPTNPRQEIVIALAGPIVNLVIAGGLALGIALSGAAAGAGAAIGGDFVARLLWTNVVLAVFNLLPAFPMDGGRVLRAALSFARSRLEATEIAVKVGRVLAVGLGILGMLFSPIQMLIAAFIWFAGGQELRAVRMQEAAAAGPPYGYGPGPVIIVRRHRW